MRNVPVPVLTAVVGAVALLGGETGSVRADDVKHRDGVRPIMRFASAPTARIAPFRVLTATTLGSLSTMPRPRTYTSVLAVPRSTAMSRPRKPVIPSGFGPGEEILPRLSAMRVE